MWFLSLCCKTVVYVFYKILTGTFVIGLKISKSVINFSRFMDTVEFVEFVLYVTTAAYKLTNGTNAKLPRLIFTDTLFGKASPR